MDKVRKMNLNEATTENVLKEMGLAVLQEEVYQNVVCFELHKKKISFPQPTISILLEHPARHGEKAIGSLHFVLLEHLRSTR